LTCYYPKPAYRLVDGGITFTQRGGMDVLGDINIPCARCIGCRLAKSSEWGLRGRHESMLHSEACFITPTYADEHVPKDGSLRYEDLQKFFKRARHAIAPKRIRFLACGEYGEELGRPHYHACIWGHSWIEDRYQWSKSKTGGMQYRSAALEKLWPHGHILISDLSEQLVAYVARYTMKKVVGREADNHYTSVDTETGELLRRTPEFAHMSTRPGIGAGWLEKYSGDIAHGYAVAGGKRRPVPAYYLRKLKRMNPDLHESILSRRIVQSNDPRFARLQADSTPERLATREEVHVASIRTLKRT